MHATDTPPTSATSVMQELNPSVTPHAPQYDLTSLVIPLLKSELDRDEDPHAWDALLKLQARVRDYVAVLALELVLDEAEGYAFLRSRLVPDEDAPKLPRLVARRPLSFQVSLLLALLRKKLAEFDAGGADTRLVLSLEDIGELVRVFHPAGANEARALDQVESQLNRIIELGFVRRFKTASGPAYEVRRILKAFVDAQWLAEFDARLESYRQRLAAGEGEDA